MEKELNFFFISINLNNNLFEFKNENIIMSSFIHSEKKHKSALYYTIWYTHYDELIREKKDSISIY